MNFRGRFGLRCRRGCPRLNPQRSRTATSRPRRAATRTRSSASSSRTGASSTRTATGCSARRTTPRTRSRTRCCAPGGRSARFEGRSSLRVLALPDRDQRLSRHDRRSARSAVLPIDYGAAADPHDGPGEPLVESVWIEPVSRRGARPRGRLRRARRRATSSARASSSPSSPRSSTCRRASARC